MNKFMLGIAAAAACVGMSATAATVNGLFTVTAVNVTNLDRIESQATEANFDAAFANTLGGGNSVSVSDTFTYDGDLDFRQGSGNGALKVGEWLGLGTGSVTGLAGALGDLQLSKGNIDNDDATSTFFRFELANYAAADFDITHDDGVSVFDDGALLGSFVGPTSEVFTEVNGFNGGALSFIYVATNSNPSIFEVDADISAVPLPASMPLLLAGLGLVGWAGRRRK